MTCKNRHGKRLKRLKTKYVCCFIDRLRDHVKADKQDQEQHCISWSRTQLITQLNALVLAVVMTTSHSYLPQLSGSTVRSDKLSCLLSTLTKKHSGDAPETL